MPKFFSGSDLVFFAGGGVVTCRAHLLAFSQHNDITVIHNTHLNDLISWPLYVYYEKTALKYVYPQK